MAPCIISPRTWTYKEAVMALERLCNFVPFVPQHRYGQRVVFPAPGLTRNITRHHCRRQYHRLWS